MRIVVAHVAVAAALFHGAAVSDAAQPTATVVIIKQIADALGAVGDAIGKLTDGVQKMVVAGDKGWSTVKARRTHDELVSLSQEITGLAEEQRIGMLPLLESYIGDPRDPQWAAARGRLVRVLTMSDSILSRLNRDRSDLVLQPAYAQLRLAMRARVSLLSKLQAAPPPRTRAELAQLRRVVSRYKILIIQLEAARDELNEYARVDR